MARTTWDQQELPFLRRLADGPPLRDGSIYQFCAGLGLTSRETTEMLKDLKLASYIVLDVKDIGGDRFGGITALRLAPAGRRMLGLWPREEAVAEDLVAAMIAELSGRIAAADTEDEKSNLRAILSTLGSAGRDFLYRFSRTMPSDRQNSARTQLTEKRPETLRTGEMRKSR